MFSNEVTEQKNLQTKQTNKKTMDVNRVKSDKLHKQKHQSLSVPKWPTLQWMTTTWSGSALSQLSMALQMVQILSRGGACRSGQPVSSVCGTRSERGHVTGECFTHLRLVLVTGYLNLCNQSPNFAKDLWVWILAIKEWLSSALTKTIWIVVKGHAN